MSSSRAKGLKLPASEAGEFVELLLLYKDLANIVTVDCVAVEC
jgi:hypothetical protein